MTLTVQPTTSVVIDNIPFQVDTMSAEVQQMVKYYDDWRDRELEATSTLLMVRAALKDLQNTILETVQKEKAAAETTAPEATQPSAANEE